MSSALNVCDAKGAEPILSVERATMRPFILISAVLVFASPAAAHNWQEYSYPDYSFSITFPAGPQTETTTYQVTGDRKVEAHVYSVLGNNAEFKVTVAELADPGLEQTVVIDHAIKTLSEGGAVKADVPHHIRGVFGRELSIVQGDGSRVAVALFIYHGRLDQIEGKSPPGGHYTAADAFRFVQSLIFTGGGSNRSADETLADQSACSGPRGPRHDGVPGAAVAGDDRRFEIECRRQHAQVALRDSNTGGARQKTRQWHFVDIEISAPNLDAACFNHPAVPAGTVASNGPAADCVIDKIQEFAAELANPATDLEEQVVALKFLLHFVGDVHQPLHSSDDNDRGGNNKKVSASGFKAGNLHHFWDTEFVDNLETDPKSIASDLIGHISPTQVGTWQAGSPPDWAMESFKIAKSDAYGLLPEPTARGSFRLSDEYVTTATDDVAQQLSKAGVRLCVRAEQRPSETIEGRHATQNSRASFLFGRKLLDQVRPVAGDDAAYLGVDLGNIVEAFFDLPPFTSSGPISRSRA